MKEYRSAFSTAEYDEKIRKTLPYYDEFYRQVVDVVKAHTHGPLTWLDVGCGTGKMAEVALPCLDLERFIFSDLSEEMIGTVRKRFDLPISSFLVSDVRETEYPFQVDVVTAIQVNHYFSKEERLRALKNCHRALKPGGLFFTFENFAPLTETGRELYLQRWKNYQLSQGKSPEECEGHLKRYGRDYFPITLPEHFEVMREGGFQTTEVLWLSYMQLGLWGMKEE